VTGIIDMCREFSESSSNPAFTAPARSWPGVPGVGPH